MHVQVELCSDGLMEKIRHIPGVALAELQTDRIAIRLHEDKTSIEDLHDAIHAAGGAHPHVPARSHGHGNGVHETHRGKTGMSTVAATEAPVRKKRLRTLVCRC